MPFLYSESLCKNGQHFVDIQYNIERNIIKNQKYRYSIKIIPFEYEIKNRNKIS